MPLKSTKALPATTGARWVWPHEAAAHISVMQQTKAGLQFLFGLCNFEDQLFVRLGVAVDKRPVHGKTHRLRKDGKRLAQQAMKKSFHFGSD
jgi:anthranilate/para-aminobenzoate synthase component II